MNNITAFPMSAHYQTVDVAALRQAVKEAGDASIEVQSLFINTEYLPALHARIKASDSAMRAAQFKLQETVQALDLDLKAHVKTLRHYQSELATATGSEKQEVLEDIAKVVTTIVGTVRKNQTELDRVYAPMTVEVDRAATGSYLTQLLADQQRLPAESLEIKVREEALQGKRQTLTQAMTLIESKGFAEVGKETLLDAQNIATLAAGGPEVAVLSTAIELAQQTLENVESFINYIGLMNARDAIRKQIDELLNRIQGKTIELRTVEMKAKLIQASNAFEDQRIRYTAEFSKVGAAAKSFVGTYQNVDPSAPDALAQLAADALGLAKFVKASV